MNTAEYVQTDDCLMIIGDKLTDSWNTYAVVSSDGVNFTSVNLYDVISQKYGNSEIDQYSVCDVITIDNKFYISVFINSSNITEFKMLVTENGKDYEEYTLPEAVGKLASLEESLTFKKFKDTYIMFVSGEAYPDSQNKYTYYTSTDLENWTERFTPAITDISDSELYASSYGYWSQAGMTVSIESVTDNGVYFSFSTDKYLHGLYYSEDFVNYTKVIDDYAADDSLSVSSASYPDGTKSFVLYNCGFSGGRKFKILSFDENTLTTRIMYSSDKFLNYWQAFFYTDPLSFFVCENGQYVLRTYSTQTDKIIHEGTVDWTNIYGGGYMWNFEGNSENDQYELRFNLRDYGKTLSVSDNLYKSIYDIDLESELGTTDVYKIGGI